MWIIADEKQVGHGRLAFEIRDIDKDRVVCWTPNLGRAEEVLKRSHFFESSSEEDCGDCGSDQVHDDPSKERCDKCFYKFHVQDLLAVMHGDGGHFTEAHGIVKSVKTAVDKYHARGQ